MQLSWGMGPYDLCVAALAWAFSVIVQPFVEPMDQFAALKEIHIRAEMEHDNIIYLHQVYENQQYVILIIEL